MHQFSEYADAAFWERLLQNDPRDVHAHVAVVTASATRHDEAVLLARRAEARSHFDLGEMQAAVAAAEAALAVAASSDPTEARHLTVMTASVILAEAGDAHRALDHLRALRSDTDGAWAGRAHLQIACVLMPIGRTAEALVELDASAALLDATGDGPDRWRVHYNRGFGLLQQGRFDAAEAALTLAGDIALADDLTLFAAQAHGALGVLHGRTRQLRQALDHFDAADDLFDRCGRPGRVVMWAEIDRAEVLMHSGLHADAVVAASSAVELAATSGNRTALGDAQIVLAKAELAVGAHRRAQRSADRALQILGDSERDDVEGHARAIVEEARLLDVTAADDGERVLEQTRGLVADLLAEGWVVEARQLMRSRVKVAHRFGLEAHVHADLDTLERHTIAGRTAELDRAYAGAIRLQLVGSTREASRRAIEGVDLVDEIVAEAPTLAERSAAMSIGHDLSRLIIDLSMDLGDAHTVFAAAEGTRARALHDELGRSDRHQPLTADGARRLESAVRDALGGRQLIEWIAIAERLCAIVVNADGVRFVDVGPERSIRRACDRVQAWLDIAAAEPDEDPQRARAALALLDELLMLPLEIPATADIVIVPDGFLHALPWAGLPTCSRRGLTVAPSCQLWLQAERRSATPTSDVTAILGPDVDSADTERAAVLALSNRARVVDGAAATVEALRTSLTSEGLVHLAAHGTFRSDRPLLSTVRLADGEASVDAALPAAIGASLVVLSSCEGGASGTSDGSEVLGLAALLLSRGAHGIVAPLTAVRDLDCAEFVAEVYEELTSGLPVGTAMAHVRRRWLNSGTLGRVAVAASFLCVGSSMPRLASETRELQ